MNMNRMFLGAIAIGVFGLTVSMAADTPDTVPAAASETIPEAVSKTVPETKHDKGDIGAKVDVEKSAAPVVTEKKEEASGAKVSSTTSTDATSASTAKSGAVSEKGKPSAVTPAPAATPATSDMTVDEIVRRTNHTSYYQGRNGRANVTMEITDAQGRARAREFIILRMDMDDDAADAASGDQKMYVYFERPADVNKTAYLVHKHVAADDDRWLFLPGLNLVKRIAASDTRTSFVGSHFFYEDVSGRSLDADVHTLEKTTAAAYCLKNTPKDPKSVEFAYYLMWIDKKTFTPYSIQYFDAAGKKYRELSALAVETIGGFPTVTKAVMTDVRTGGKTTMTYNKVDYNIDLPEEVFTERYLRNAPRKYLR